MRVYLLRHGETDWNITRRLQGSMNIPLNETGVQQAQSWRPYFDGIRFAGVYSSTLDRAMDTAMLATGRPGCLVEGFNERGFGEWEGRLWSELESTATEFDERWKDNSFCPPGGESRQQLFDRVALALTKTVLTHPQDADVLIVAHGASGHAIMASLLKLPIDDRGTLPSLKNASLTIISLRDASFTYYLMGSGNISQPTTTATSRNETKTNTP